MKIYLDNNFPKRLAEAIGLIQSLQIPQEYEILRTQDIDKSETEDVVLLLFDNKKKGLDIVTEKHFESGYKVIAFKKGLAEKLNLYDLALTTIRLWPKMLQVIKGENDPFIFTYSCNSKSLQKVKIE
jgi:hypothetical protein